MVVRIAPNWMWGAAAEQRRAGGAGQCRVGVTQGWLVRGGRSGWNVPVMASTPFVRRLGRLVVGLLVAASLHAADGPPAPGLDLPKPDRPPKVVKQEPPVYPANLRMAGVVGQVKVAFIVDAQGRVIEAHPASSNNPWFERPAIEAVKRWKFEPAQKNGKPVNARMMVPIYFNLEGGRNTEGYWRVPALREPEKLPPALRWTKAPEPVSTTFPLYPFEALRDKKKGHTKIRFLIGPDGRVMQSQLLEASEPEFGYAALAMIDRWQFKPAKLADGSPGQALLGIEHDFTPSGRGDVPVPDGMREVLRLVTSKPEQIVAWNELDRKPRPYWQHAPVYPTALRQKGETGSALIEFYVDEEGDAQLPRIVEATAPEFGYAAALAVATWRFEPPLKNGKPVVAKVQIPLTFSLKDPVAPKPAPAANPEAAATETPPKLVRSVAPRYPREHLRNEVSGAAVVGLTVDEKGAVSNVHVVSESHPGFGAAAVEAVKQWQFEPAREGGQPVARTFEREVQFNVKGR